MSHLHQQVQLRFLGPADVPQVKLLCSQCFPVEYSDKWFKEISSNPAFFSLAATINSCVVGMIVCEVKSVTRLNLEDVDILASYFKPPAQVAYILSLGVDPKYRKKGIASLLLENLLCHLTTPEQTTCKAVYLHVLCENYHAVQFYERRGFYMNAHLPAYYWIQQMPYDGYCYVLHINGGHVAAYWDVYGFCWRISNMLKSLRPCSLPSLVMRGARDMWQSLSRFLHAHYTVQLTPPTHAR